MRVGEGWEVSEVNPAVWATEASFDDDTAEEGDRFVLEGLDERMRPFMERHTPCRWQMRLL